jgi:hypothetical protein
MRSQASKNLDDKQSQVSHVKPVWQCIVNYDNQKKENSTKLRRQVEKAKLTV